MFLYEAYLNNGMEYGDEDYQTKLIVEENMGLATKRAKKLLKETYGEDEDRYRKPYFYVERIEEVDGYEITLKKKKVQK